MRDPLWREQHPTIGSCSAVDLLLRLAVTDSRTAQRGQAPNGVTARWWAGKALETGYEGRTVVVGLFGYLYGKLKSMV